MPNFPGLQGFANDKLWTDEWYEFGPEKITGLNYILGVDESTYNPKVHWGARGKGEGMGRCIRFHGIMIMMVAGLFIRLLGIYQQFLVNLLF